MNSYLMINVILTGAALTINHHIKTPHRIRFYILLTAVIAWLIPFGLMSIELPQQTMALLPIQITQLNEPILSNNPISQSQFSIMTAIYTLLVMGLCRFLFDLFATLKQVQKLKHQSKPYLDQKNIRLARGINGAFVSGYLKPIIWLDEHLTRTDTLSSVITHEQQHIQSHDQFWLFIITLVQRVFWFNPLSLLLCHQCKKSIELSCDEACKKQLGQKLYQSHLAQLVKSQHHKTHTLMNNQIHQNKGFNIHRIKQLDQENIMTKFKTTQLSFIVLSALLLSTYSLITVARNVVVPAVADNQVLLALKIQRNDEKPTELSILTNQGEMAHVTYDNHDFGFTTQVSEAEPTQIYTQIAINKIDNGVKTQIANPGIVTTNTQWGAFKFGADETYFDIEIMARTSSDMDPVAEAVDNYIEKNDPIPAALAIPALPTATKAPSVPAASAPTSAPAASAPTTPPLKPVSEVVPKPVSEPAPPLKPTLVPVPELKKN